MNRKERRRLKKQEERKSQAAGTFNPAPAPDQIVALDVSFTDADAVGVSIEPLGGSVAPTGDIVLLGSPQ